MSCCCRNQWNFEKKTKTIQVESFESFLSPLLIYIDKMRGRKTLSININQIEILVVQI